MPHSLLDLENRRSEVLAQICALGDSRPGLTEAKLGLEDEGIVLDKVLHDLPWQHMLFSTAP